VNQRSIQIYGMAKATLEQGFAPVMSGPGSPEWDYVHIHDLGQFFALAVDAALDKEKAHNSEIFGPNGYFFVENGSHSWRRDAELIAKAAKEQGYIKEAEVKEGDYKNFGANSKGVAQRARKYFGWKPTGRSLEEEIPDIVKGEAQVLGK